MMQLVLGLALTMAALLVSASCGGGEDSASVHLGEEAGSGQSGTATVTAQGEKTRVVIEVLNPPAHAQPSHIHRGTCKDPNPQPAFPLTNVVDGKATTTVDVPLEALQSRGNYYVNVHESAAEIETVVACGDIMAGAKAPSGGSGGY